MKTDETFTEALQLITDMTGLDKGPTEEEYDEWHERAWKFLTSNRLISERCYSYDN